MGAEDRGYSLRGLRSRWRCLNVGFGRVLEVWLYSCWIFVNNKDCRTTVVEAHGYLVFREFLRLEVGLECGKPRSRMRDPVVKNIVNIKSNRQILDFRFYKK